LVESAQIRPSTNFVGVEIDRGLQLFTANRIAKRNLSNVRLVCCDALFFLRDFVAADSLTGVHVYFPDPWWKRRHRKRRVVTGEFAAQCERVLAPGGRLHIATDVEEYFQVMIGLLGVQPRLVREEPAAFLTASPTNFERKALQQGRGVHRAVYRKSEPVA
jgi:tRNA (guanine-N7-)-methyltransferase